MRIVIDTDVLVAALRSDRGASRQILLLALERKIVTLASVPLVLEYEAVTTRPEHLAVTGLTAGETNDVIDAMASVIEQVQLRFLWRPKFKDLKDEMALETAVHGQATHIATFSGRHMQTEAAKFGISAKQPREILQTIRLVNGVLFL